MGSDNPESGRAARAARAFAACMAGHADAYAAHLADPAGTEDQWNQHLTELGRLHWRGKQAHLAAAWWEERCAEGVRMADRSCPCDYHEEREQMGAYEPRRGPDYRSDGRRPLRRGLQLHARWLARRAA